MLSLLSSRYSSRIVLVACFVIAASWTVLWPRGSRAEFDRRLGEHSRWPAQPWPNAKAHQPRRDVVLPPFKSQSTALTTIAQLGNWRSSRDGDERTFVLYQDDKGEFGCREATSEERKRIADRSGGGPTRVIYSGAPRQKDLPEGTTVWTPHGLEGSTLQVSAGLRIVLHGTAQLEQNQAAKAAFIVAANRWEALISTPITVVIDVDFGTTFFGTPYPSSSILGATGLDTVVGPFSDLRQRLITSASTANEQQLYNALPASALPVQLDGVNSNAASVEAAVPNARALGIVPDITDPNSVPLGQGDAGIGFNSAFQFDFSPDDGISSGRTDFDAVASHEIGHALGFISDSGDGVSSPVTPWDIFRFRPSAVSLATFGTVPRIMSQGGSQVFFGNQLTTYATLELGLSTGGSDPGPGDGDGRQSSHWRDDVLLSTRPYIGVMDPTLGSGLRRTISENDILAIDLFGYSIGAPPPVRPPNDNFVNAIVLQSNAGMLTGTNVSATREAGEPIHVGLMGDKSVWYSWASPLNGQITIDTIGSNFDTTLAVYTGNTISLLGNIAQNDDIVAGSNRASRVQFNITAGTTYRIVVDGWNSEYGNITLNWSATGSVPSPSPTPSPSPSPTPSPSPSPTPSPSPSPSPSPTPTPPCLDDVWTGTSTTDAPAARRLHTAVWTGTEMIIWGGHNQSANPINTGARYNPSTNTWTATSTVNAPQARSEHTAVWTGTEMIVWGGLNGSLPNTGARYNPSTDSWTTISTVNAPTRRALHSAVWTGSEMIVWGGSGDSGDTNTGGRYNPTTDTWTATSLTNAPSLRSFQSAIWTGTEMIVWGGYGPVGYLNTGGRYNPGTDSWTAITTTNAPSARASSGAVWTGSEMIVWGGAASSGNPITGGKYNPNTDTWTSTATTNAPAGRFQHATVWSGTEMIVWGGHDAGNGKLNDGGRYNPTTDTWIATCHLNAPAARDFFTGIWTGTQMIVWGGDDSNFSRLNTGGRYLVQQGPIQLLLDTSGPAIDQAAALDSILYLRDPFRVLNTADLLNLGSDRNTRVVISVTNLQLAQGEPSSAVVVNLINANSQSYDIPAEDVRLIPNTIFTQVIFRLPDNLPVGTCVIKVKAHNQTTNSGTLRIKS
jgi:N-acetylneuraminic acid mutarotase